VMYKVVMCCLRASICAEHQVVPRRVCSACVQKGIAALSQAWPCCAGSGSLLRRGLQDVSAFRLPNQTNRLALVFDPLSDKVKTGQHCAFKPLTHCRSHCHVYVTHYIVCWRPKALPVQGSISASYTGILTRCPSHLALRSLSLDTRQRHTHIPPPKSCSSYWQVSLCCAQCCQTDRLTQ
jgi:hypothetical protein